MQYRPIVFFEQWLVPDELMPIEKTAPGCDRIADGGFTEQHQLDIFTDGQPAVNLKKHIRAAFRQPAKTGRQIAGVQMAAGAVVDFSLIEFGA